MVTVERPRWAECRARWTMTVKSTDQSRTCRAASVAGREDGGVSWTSGQSLIRGSDVVVEIDSGTPRAAVVWCETGRRRRDQRSAVLGAAGECDTLAAVSNCPAPFRRATLLRAAHPMPRHHRRRVTGVMLASGAAVLTRGATGSCCDRPGDTNHHEKARPTRR